MNDSYRDIEEIVDPRKENQTKKITRSKTTQEKTNNAFYD